METSTLVILAAFVGASLSVLIMFNSLFNARRTATMHFRLLRDAESWVSIAEENHLAPLGQRIAALEDRRGEVEEQLRRISEKIENARQTYDEALVAEIESDQMNLRFEQTMIDRELAEIFRLQTQFPQDWAEEVVAKHYPDLRGENREYAVNFVASLVREKVGDSRRHPESAIRLENTPARP